MTRPTSFVNPFPQGVGGVGGDPTLPPGQEPVDCCDDAAEMPDRALDGNIFIGVTSGDGTLVQSRTATDGGGGSSLAYTSDTTAGNLLVCVLVDRGGTGSVDTPSGWTFIEEAGRSGAREVTMWWRVAPGGPVTVSFVNPTNEVRIYLMEFAGGGAGLATTPTTHDGGASVNSFPVPSLTVTGPSVLVGTVEAGNGVPNTITYTEDPDFTNVGQGQVGGSLDPESIVGYRVVSAGSYDYEPTGNNNSTGWGGILAAFDLGEGWFGGGYLSVDGDDATYTEITGGNVIRIWLGDAFAIGRIRLLIGTETAGAKTYTLKGANAADYSDAVTVATLNWTATGSFTADEVLESWAVTDSYEFWELTGDDETRYVYSFELYEAANEDASVVQAALDDHIADPVDAHDASAVSVADSPGWTTATDVEAYLAELGGKVQGYQAHGNLGTTETFDAATGWHSGTLNANCTFTLTATASGMACQMLLELAQDGTGGWTITLPSSVSNKAELEAAQDTTLSTTSFLILMTRDGGTTWYGFWAGGSGGPDLSAIDFLVGTASGDLSSEIVVGTTPGGDLGGTWASPDVEAIQGVVVTDAGTTGDVLTKTGAATATWSTPSASGRWELAVVPGSPPDPLYADGDFLYIFVP